MKFRKKPVVIEAMRWDGRNANDIAQWAQGGWKADGMWIKQVPREPGVVHYALVIPTLEGWATASVGDWIIKGVAGEFYLCKPEIFEATYSPAEDATPSAAEAPGPIEPNSAREWDLELRACGGANDQMVPKYARRLIADLWAEVVAREPEAKS